MSERYWYQDGSTVVWSIVVAGFLVFMGYGMYQKAQQEALPYIVPKLSGEFHQPLVGGPTLEITVWHQYPATLQNVVLVVNANEDPAGNEAYQDQREHSFVSWQPNQDHAVKFKFLLKRYDPKQAIHFKFSLRGTTIKPYNSRADWVSTGWKEEK
jgi:hypothetical protein